MHTNCLAASLFSLLHPQGLREPWSGAQAAPGSRITSWTLEALPSSHHVATPLPPPPVTMLTAQPDTAAQARSWVVGGSGECDPSIHPEPSSGRLPGLCVEVWAPHTQVPERGHQVRDVGEEL